MEFAGLVDAQLNRVKRDRAVRLLFQGRQIAIGEFHCAPDDPRWSEDNCADEGYFVAFPGTSVVIKQAGREAAVTTRNEVVLYNEGQCYRRGLVDPSGDHCVFLMVAPSLLAETSVALGSVQDEERVAFSSHLVPVAASTFLLQRLIVRMLRSGETPPDDVRVEEALHRVVFDVARVGFAPSRRERRPRRRRTLRAHALVVEETKALLARRLAEQLSLAQIAREMHVSPFHLGRIFRERTGFGVHEYRDQLRLRFALDRVLERDVTLSALAFELGYASHSHFTDSFRRVFGVPPSAVRPSARALSELREQLVALP
jgi:AraC-like DNA-binding protein